MDGPKEGHNGASAHVGMREMEEAILPPFREAINAGALSVMSSYNEIDGILLLLTTTYLPKS